MKNILFFAALASTLSFTRDANAWDYLEHAWFTDESCHYALDRLSSEIDESNFEAYVALGLMCPAPEAVYCSEGDKAATAHLNLREDSDDYGVTLGDYAALPDHVSRFGPMPGFEHALDDGMVQRTLEWLTRPGSAGGVIEDVGEDACETDLADFAGARSDVRAELNQLDKTGLAKFDKDLLLPGLRAEAKRGPSDPAARYSFNNPHYLDLVIRNHTHFGEAAFSAWTGLHSAALAVSKRRCEDVVPLDEEVLEDLADEMPGFDQINWEEHVGEDRAKMACRMFAVGIRQRIERWRDSPHAAAVRERLETLSGDAVDGIFAKLLALTFEGAALHFLQDGLASGHMRTIRSREDLSEVRHDHDLDNHHGVVADLQTAAARHRFFAYGDAHLLAESPAPGCLQGWPLMNALDSVIPEVLTACSIRHQRGILVAATTASLLDVSLGGPAFERSTACSREGRASNFVCRFLPIRATEATGHTIPDIVEKDLQPGVLPVPPPEYSYQSLSIRIGLEVPSNVQQLGVKVSFLEQLDNHGHWLTSWRFGLHTTLGDGGDNQWVADASYHFHYRLSARFMFEMGPFWFAGLRDVSSDVGFFAGIGPSVGVAALPEGWITLPLELSLTYRLPLVMLSSDNGFFGDEFIDGHWMQFGVGLAYSH